MPALYIVATPIGNLEDISHRAVRILRQVHLIAAEDTRTTLKLLRAYGVRTRLISYYEQGKRSRLPYLMEQLRKHEVALVSEAGTPGISDPGYDLVRAALAQGISVIGIPGPSAVITALAVSGLPCDQFTYVGFLPRKAGDRKRFLQSISGEPRTLVALEAPHRLLASLGDIAEILGDRRIAVCRELTKLHEEVFRATVRQAIDHFREPLGEFTVVIEGSAPQPAGVTQEVRERLRDYRSRGVPARKAVGEIATATGLPKNLLYRAWLDLS
ncbi:MAG: 16S rRNA (cytidine(1402)-2'-O)-methyltransferase [Dehalococcoidia bacterium]|nr:16S rRNA (cytidine(1402)-2'-O)-methyltransferase [Dehalococcoidia bacterium]